jgi:hypothetical protein
MLNNLQKHFETAAVLTVAPMPSGTRRQVGEELVKRCTERDLGFEKQAIEAERDGDADGCWIAMAARAENKRVMEQIKKDLANEPK